VIDYILLSDCTPNISSSRHVCVLYKITSVFSKRYCLM